MRDSFLQMIATREHNAALLTLYERPNTICYLEAEDSVTHLFLENETRYTINASLNDLEVILPSNKFFYCGKSYLVNVEKVFEYWISSDPILVISCGHIIPVPNSELYQVHSSLVTQSEGLSLKPKIISRI
ncbi:LytTR family DNA-binding domain-containing protein [Perlabentimonas gracilis]|uniref:LytTR family DNA-binding domain-containing protein n=1 Tax=Perlabentimonas gracilis TaxID=2715279 RepID=UPI00140E5227|nr:LytTR family DNA-binding domain-containing protein [Perlabentimonas gracilis]NHB70174.1 LytTR family transcriptional regulator [Perlabentimonas gracilis]